MKKRNITIAFLSVMVVILLCSTVLFAYGGGYIDKILFRYFGVERQNENENDSIVVGWSRSLLQQRLDADVVFFGDSITSEHDWQSEFPDQLVVNLGIPGNALADMYTRLNMVTCVNPKKIFIMGGINGIRNGVTEVYLERYRTIVTELQERLPGTKIYVQSVLPISKNKENYCCSNSTIVDFNTQLEVIAEEYGCVYIDLWGLFVEDGVINPNLTRDGVHINEEGYVLWVNKIREHVEQ